jgi:hypothetical protein
MQLLAKLFWEKFVPPERFELPTPGAEIQCSSTELRRLVAGSLATGFAAACLRPLPRFAQTVWRHHRGRFRVRNCFGIEPKTSGDLPGTLPLS